MTSVLDASDITTTQVTPVVHARNWRKPQVFMAGLLTVTATVTLSSSEVWASTSCDCTVIPSAHYVRGSRTSATGLGEQVRDLKESSGLSWAQFAGVFGVTRRAVHFWAEGRNLSADNLARLERVRLLLRRLANDDPSATRSALFTVNAGGKTPYAELVEELSSEISTQEIDTRPLGSEEVESGVGAPGRPVATETFRGVTLRRE